MYFSVKTKHFFVEPIGLGTIFIGFYTILIRFSLKTIALDSVLVSLA